MKCMYCEREIANKGSLAAHQMSCKDNPNRITHKHSPHAGAQKGSISWNKGKHDAAKISARRKDIVENGKLGDYCEAVARRYARAYLIETTGNKCSICGIEEWQGQPVPLVCDHISGDSTDNDINNFRLVCCNCDAQLPTYKSKNKGNGRTYDREYRQKKSAGVVST
jgi:hypothetical protein